MLKKAVLIVAASSLTAPVLAQTSTAPADKPVAGSPSASASPAQFVTQPAQNQWRGSRLVGVNVFGADGARIGDINEILVNHSGSIDAVVIGVGGFLEMGEKEVAVPFTSLEWAKHPVRTSATNVSSGTASTTAGALMVTPGAAPGSGAPVPDAPLAADETFRPDRVVLRMTRADLQNATPFRYVIDRPAATSAPAGSANPSPTPPPPSPGPRK
jgi:sporulation protein YlmC with PRC-barrel domain